MQKLEFVSAIKASGSAKIIKKELSLNLFQTNSKNLQENPLKNMLNTS